VFRQIGYPSRASLVRTLWATLSRLKVGNVEGELLRNLAQRDRFVDALRLLFEVAETLYAARKAAGIAEEHAPIVLLFDEVQDLIKDSRLANVGGRFVFEELAVLLVAYGVDRRVVRTAVAGSSALLSVEFDKTVAGGARWNYQQMVDPDVDTVVTALLERGYKKEEACRIVALVGTRLRLLEPLLKSGAHKLSCDRFLGRERVLATANILDLMAVADARDSLHAICDRIVAHEAGDGDAPTLYDMSEGLRSLDFAKVLYVDLGRSVTFQSQLHRVVWGELRGKFVRQLR
jgi:hypothetical protein